MSAGATIITADRTAFLWLPSLLDLSAVRTQNQFQSLWPPHYPLFTDGSLPDLADTRGFCCRARAGAPISPSANGRKSVIWTGGILVMAAAAVLAWWFTFTLLR